MSPRWTLAAVLLVLPGVAAAAPADLLRLMPQEAGFVVVVENPRRLVESVRGLDAYRSAQDLSAVREVFESAPARRFFQLVGYYERELGAKWPDLLDKLAGGGLALGVAIAPDPAPALLVVRGTDEPTVGEFYRLALAALEQEAARNAAGSPDAAKVRRETRHGVETVHLGKDFHAARVGPALYVSNKEESLQAGLDRKAGGSVADLPGPAAARKLLGGDPLAWAWLDFARVKEGKQAQDFFATTRKDLIQTLVAGSSIDAFRRADFIAAGLFRTADGLRFAVRLPAKRSELAADLGPVHAPPAGQPGSLPLLEPKGIVYSQSFYLDVGHLWRERKAIVNEQVLKDIEKAEKDISKVLPGTTLGKLLEMSGPYHRVVVTHVDEKPYSVTPGAAVPPIAVVSSMRDRQFGKSAEAALRAAGLLASLQSQLKMAEETHDGVKIVSYRFPENGKYPGDDQNIRFGFVPSFAVVDDFLVVSSRPGLIKDLIPELRKPRSPDPAAPVWRAKAYAAGAAESIRAIPDPLVTDAVLRQGVGLDVAKKQVEQLAAWVATLGTGSLEIDHRPDAYQIQIVWKSDRR